jgi:hypothetical protein
MQALEVIMYTMLALLVGSLILAFILDFDYKATYNQLHKQAEGESQVFEIEARGFPSEVAKRWQDCSYGMLNRTYAMQLNGPDKVLLGDVIKEFRRLDQCEVIDCFNTSNRFRMPHEIAPPKIINMQCTNKTLIIKG